MQRLMEKLSRVMRPESLQKNAGYERFYAGVLVCLITVDQGFAFSERGVDTFHAVSLENILAR